MKYIHIKSILLLMLLGIIGCSTTNHEQYFVEHEKSFKERVTYKTHYVDRDGLKIHVREFGIMNDKPTIILMHGFPDSMHLYDWLVPELATDRHVITFDFIGWGDSDKPKNHVYNFNSLEQDLSSVVDRLKLKKVVLVVHDASGPTGINWAIKHQDKTEALVLLNTFYNSMPGLTAPEQIEIFSTPGFNRWVSTLATSMSDRLLINRYNQQMDKFITSIEKREPFKKILGYQFVEIRRAFYGLNKDLNAEIARNDKNLARIDEFKIPVSIIFGADDPYLNTDVAQGFNKLFHESELFLIEDAGHFVQVDQPNRVAELILLH